MNVIRQYRYVGPAEIAAAVAGTQSGISVGVAEDLLEWVRASDDWDGESTTATYVVVLDGTLRVAPRRSEHVACALGGRVLAAGELTVRLRPNLEVIAATNQSTGYCDLCDAELPQVWNFD